jgi:hypothetical protein
MKRFARVLLLISASFTLSLAAHAQSFRTYLASYGSDGNAGCTVAAPCRLLPAALNAVVDGGEVWILDSANYNAGTVNITKSVSILAVPGQIASIVAANGAEAINISTAGVKVALRNIVIPRNASNPGTGGIVMTNGTLLSIEDCLFSNLSGRAVYVHDTAANVQIKGTVFRNIGDFSVQAENGPTVVVANSQLLTTGGVFAYGSVGPSSTSVTVSDSTISHGGEGILSYATAAGAVVRAYAMRNTMHAVSYALDSDVLAGGTSTIYAAYNTIGGGAYNWWISGGSSASVVSYGNNQFSSQSATGTLTPASLQ